MLRIALPSWLESGLWYFFGQVGGWLGGEMKIKANLSQSWSWAWQQQQQLLLQKNSLNIIGFWPHRNYPSLSFSFYKNNKTIKTNKTIKIIKTTRLSTFTKSNLIMFQYWWVFVSTLTKFLILNESWSQHIKKFVVSIIPRWAWQYHSIGNLHVYSILFWYWQEPTDVYRYTNSATYFAPLF